MWNDYAKTYSEYLDRLKSVVGNFRMVEIGRSVQGRPIYAVYAYSHPYARATVAITSAIHGNEHPNPEMLLYFINDLRNKSFYVKELNELPVRYIIIPVQNPDGFEVWERRNANCVDLNRNYPAGYGGPGSAPGQCCEICRGNNALDQPESRAVYNFLKGEQFDVHIDLHTGTEAFAYPYSCPTLLGHSPFEPTYVKFCSQHSEIARKYNVEPYPCGWIPQYRIDMAELNRELLIYEACGTITDAVDHDMGKPSMLLESTYPFNPPYSDVVNVYYKRFQTVIAVLAMYAASLYPPIQAPLPILPLVTITAGSLLGSLTTRFLKREKRHV